MERVVGRHVEDTYGTRQEKRVCVEEKTVGDGLTE